MTGPEKGVCPSYTFAAVSVYERAGLLGDLDSIRGEFESLQERAEERVSQKIIGGDIASDLAPAGTEFNQTFVNDDLNTRKVIALNSFLSKRNAIARMRVGTAQADSTDILAEMVPLMILCNNTLR